WNGPLAFVQAARSRSIGLHNGSLVEMLRSPKGLGPRAQSILVHKYQDLCENISNPHDADLWPDLVRFRIVFRYGSRVHVRGFAGW
ncbi:MAG TPA: hypothetical protein VFQ54_04660, partial [Thermomicrobiales bacterium]|nr:hypothetical protein [Thermomicrobiales bacterium]